MAAPPIIEHLAHTDSRLSGVDSARVDAPPRACGIGSGKAAAHPPVCRPRPAGTPHGRVSPDTGTPQRSQCVSLRQRQLARQDRRQQPMRSPTSAAQVLPPGEGDQQLGRSRPRLDVGRTGQPSRTTGSAIHSLPGSGVGTRRPPAEDERYRDDDSRLAGTHARSDPRLDGQGLLRARAAALQGRSRSTNTRFTASRYPYPLKSSGSR